jgi:general secretion pathway protein G
MSKQSFTLIELLVIIAIIGILAAFIVVALSGAQDSAYDARRKVDISQLNKAMMIYKTDNSSSLLPVDNDGCEEFLILAL